MKTDAGQTWSPERYAANARFVSDLGVPVLDLLGPCAGLRVLDLGCGDGALTVRLRDAGASVTGVDASPEMIAAACRLGLDARVMNGAELAFDEEYDAVFSNAALHWMTRPAEVIAGVWRALRPGGHFVGEFGGHGNVATITTALEAELRARGIAPRRPWFFPTVAEYRSLLAARGFEVSNIGLFARPTPLPGSLVDWLRTFSGPYADLLAETEREEFMGAVAAACAPRLRDASGAWHVDYVRLRFAAQKPAVAA
jgi:trans-aconitate methyltransferase